MPVHTKDIGCAIMCGFDMLDEVFDTFDWDDEEKPFTGRHIFYGYDASHGFDDLRIETDDGVFRVVITRVG